MSISVSEQKDKHGSMNSPVGFIINEINWFILFYGNTYKHLLMQKCYFIVN